MPIQSDLRRSKERSLKSGELGAEPPALASESPSEGPRVIGSQLGRNDPFPTLQIVRRSPVGQRRRSRLPRRAG